MSEVNFKTASFGGFDRSDVLKYLEEQSILAKKVERALADQLEDAKRERKEATTKCSTLELRISELEKALEREKFEHHATLKAKEQIENSFEKLNRNANKNESDYSDIFEKARKYDASKQMIADTLLQAQRDANIIVENANIRSKQLSAEVYNNIDMLISRINTFKGTFNLIGADVMDISSNFKQLSDVITYVNSEITKVDESIMNMKYDSAEMAYSKTSNLASLEEMLSKNEPKKSFSDKYKTKREEKIFEKIQPKRKKYFLKDESAPENDIYQEASPVKKTEVVVEKQAANTETSKTQYVVKEGPPIITDENVSFAPTASPPLQLYVNESHGEKKEPVYAPPLHESAQKKRAVNISDILMKYSN